MEEIILTTLKNMLGIPEAIDNFDATLKVLTNTAISKLHQIGAVDPKNLSLITTGAETWDTIIESDMFISIQSYIYMYVRIAFDPPSNSFVLDALTRSMDEIEWRLKMQNEVVDNMTEEGGIL